MKKSFFGISTLVVLGIAIFLAINTLFSVKETEQVLVLQFGDHKRTITEPGLNYRLPFIQQRVVYDKRVLNLDPDIQTFFLSDQKPLDVDYYVRFRISAPLEFYQKVRTTSAARDLLENIVNSQMRDTLGNKLLEDILSEERTAILDQITSKARESALDLGIEIVDVRIGKADLPQAISKNVFARMETERKEEAFEFRAQGQRAKTEIQAEADREVRVVLAKAERESQVLRGEGEAARERLLAEAYADHLEFYEFFITLDAYKQSMLKGTSALILTTDFDFLKQLNFDAAEQTAAPSTPRISGATGN